MVILFQTELIQFQGQAMEQVKLTIAAERLQARLLALGEVGALAGGGVYTYTVNATAPCTGNDTVTVTVSEQARSEERRAGDVGRSA